MTHSVFFLKKFKVPTDSFFEKFCPVDVGFKLNKCVDSKVFWLNNASLCHKQTLPVHLTFLNYQDQFKLIKLNITLTCCWRSNKTPTGANRLILRGKWRKWKKDFTPPSFLCDCCFPFEPVILALLLSHRLLPYSTCRETSTPECAGAPPHASTLWYPPSFPMGGLRACRYTRST